MDYIDQLEEELRELFAQEIISEHDLSRIGSLEVQLDRAYALYDY